MSSLPEATLLVTGKQQYAVGLKWLTLPPGQRVDERRRALIEAYSATHTVTRTRWYDQIAFANIPAKNAKLPTFSLAAIIANRATERDYPKDWIGVFEIPNTGQFWFCAVIDNCIQPDGDSVGAIDDMLELAKAYLDTAANPKPPALIIAPEQVADILPTATHISLEELLDPAKKHKDDKDTRLEGINAGRQRRLRLVLVAIAGVIIAGVSVQGLEYFDKKQKAAADAAREMAKRAADALPKMSNEAPRIEPVLLPLPTTALPTATLLLTRCVGQFYELSPRIAGWTLTTARCDGNNITATYERGPRGIPVNELPAYLPNTITNDTGTLATYTFSMPAATARREETLLPLTQARDAFIGAFQLAKEQVSLVAVPAPPGAFASLESVPAGRLYKEAITIRPYSAFTFNATTTRAPARLTPALQLPGVTINSITVTFARDPNNHMTRAYVITGELYAL